MGVVIKKPRLNEDENASNGISITDPNLMQRYAQLSRQKVDLTKKYNEDLLRISQQMQSIQEEQIKINLQNRQQEAQQQQQSTNDNNQSSDKEEDTNQ